MSFTLIFKTSRSEFTCHKFFARDAGFFDDQLQTLYVAQCVMIAGRDAKVRRQPLERILRKIQLVLEDRQSVEVSGHVIGQLPLHAVHFSVVNDDGRVERPGVVRSKQHLLLACHLSQPGEERLESGNKGWRGRHVNAVFEELVVTFLHAMNFRRSCVDVARWDNVLGEFLNKLKAYVTIMQDCVNIIFFSIFTRPYTYM